MTSDSQFRSTRNSLQLYPIPTLSCTYVVSNGSLDPYPGIRPCRRSVGHAAHARRPSTDVMLLQLAMLSVPPVAVEADVLDCGSTLLPSGTSVRTDGCCIGHGGVIVPCSATATPFGHCAGKKGTHPTNAMPQFHVMDKYW